MESSLEQSNDLSKHQRCPYCHDDFDDSADTFCTVCNASQHLECFFEHKSCSVHGCENAVMSHKEVIFSYADIQAFETFADFQFFLQESLEVERALQEQNLKARSESKSKDPSKAKSKRDSSPLKMLILPALVIFIQLTFDSYSANMITAALILTSVVIYGVMKLALYLESKDPAEKNKPGSIVVEKTPEENRLVQLQPFNFWRDVMGQTGFDPLMGMNPGSITLPLLEEDDEGGSRRQGPEKGDLLEDPGDSKIEFDDEAGKIPRSPKADSITPEQKGL